MKRIRVALLAALLAPVVAGCAGKCASGPARAPAPPLAAGQMDVRTAKLEPFACGTVALLHTYDGVFVASQPSASDFEQMRTGGVRTVLNLRPASENPELDEAKVVGDLGLRYVNMPVAGPADLTDDALDRAREVMNTAERPLLVHCAGAARAGAVWLAWRALDGGLPVDAAAAEARTAGLSNPALEARAREYVVRRAAPR